MHVDIFVTFVNTVVEKKLILEMSAVKICLDLNVLHICNAFEILKYLDVEFGCAINRRRLFCVSTSIYLSQFLCEVNLMLEIFALRNCAESEIIETGRL